MPKQKKPRKKKQQPKPRPKRNTGVLDKRPAFLKAYTATASITRAAELVKIDRGAHYEWLNEKQYAADFKAAQIQAAQALEDEAVRRAHEGTLEPVIYQGRQMYEPVIGDDGKPIEREDGTYVTRPSYVRKFSDALLTFLLKGFKPEKFKERVQAEHSGPGGGPIPILDARLAALTDSELEQLESIYSKLTDAAGDRSGETPAGA